ncbi:MAG TPA: SET domain-containing protein-lysine N-methyltransferase [Candidatus Saccharimonadales bacterium]|nr:SET domain-containing protein-lysine N-methyltransferase [Candidatus Saccharimonadales bacterium]
MQSTPYFDSADIEQVLPTFGSPALIIDAEIIRRQMRKFLEALPGITPYYSVKTNPHPLVLDTLREFGAHYDAATLGEIKLLLGRGVNAEAILFTHPVKTEAEIHEALALGVTMFTLDSLSELQRLAHTAPNARYFLRLALMNNASLYDYKRKFGASLHEAREILDYAAQRQLPVAGISFMVGSQSMRLEPWDKALRRTLELFTEYYSMLPSLRTVNIGSGFPLPYAFDETLPSLTEIGDLLHMYQTRFPQGVRFIAEPGRFIAGPAAALKTTVTRRLSRSDQQWLYVNANAYSGLIEIIESGGKFRYPISSDAGGEPWPFTVAGKTLDPDDRLGDDVLLGSETTEGSVLTVRDAGAYSTSFFTDYHTLPHPSIIMVDSKYAKNVHLTMAGMGIGGLQAKHDFMPAELLFRVSGQFVRKRSRTSFQVDVSRHIEPTIFGAFLNHSCDPNVGVRSNAMGHYDIIARRPIAAGEDIAVDYAMFEYETGPMSSVPCLCGSPKCRRHITGYKDLPANLRDEYRDCTASYLIQHYADQAGTQTEAEAVAA